MAVAAGAAAVHRIVRRRYRQQAGAQGAGGTRDLVGGFAPFRQGDQEPADVLIAGIAVQDPAEDFAGLRLAEMGVCGGQRLHAATATVSMPQIARKLPSRA